MAPGHRYSFWNDRQVSDSKMLGVMLVLSTGIQRGWWQACLELVWYIYLPRPFLQIGSQPVNLAGLELNRVYQTDLEPFRPISWQNLYNKKRSFTPSRPAIIVISPPLPFSPSFSFSLFTLLPPPLLPLPLECRDEKLPHLAYSHFLNHQAVVFVTTADLFTTRILLPE